MENKEIDRKINKEISIYTQGGHRKTENPLIIFPNRIIKS